MTTTLTPQSNPVGGYLVTYTQETRSRTAESNVTGAASNIYSIEVINPTADNVFLKVYDTAGAVTAGSTIPNWVFRVPGNTTTTFSCPDTLVVTAGVSLMVALDGGTGLTSTLGPTGNVVAYVLTA